jgi:FG-GAP-like repeat/FG-GAP repeat
MTKFPLLLALVVSLCLLSACGGSGGTPPPPPATHFSITAPANAAAATAFQITVTALDASNNVVASYTGTVHFTSSDGQAMLPANSTLMNGAGNFSATLKTVGNQTITATDTVTASITGTSSSISVLNAATHFSVTAPANATTGTAFQITVTALDASNNVEASYAGTVHFTSTDAQAMLPVNSPLMNGTANFSVTLKTDGNQTIAATDTATASITGTSNSITISGPATHLSINAPADATPGTAFQITVTALDTSNNVSIAYPGTVHFTSTDSHAGLPANSTLTNGSANFPATLKTVGGQTITATDTATASITGTSNSITVSAGTAANPVPFINQPLSPDATVPGGKAITLTLNGSGFVSGAVVHWNGSPRATKFISNSKLTASIPATDIATLNTASVTTVNPAPGGGTSNVAFFEVTRPTSWAAVVSPVSLPGGGFSAVVTGDFNNDGKLDLVVANNEGDNVSILLGNGSGTFQPAVSYSAGAGTLPDAIAAGDFNGDGKLDLAVASNGGVGNVSILLGNGDGTLQPAVEYLAASNPSSIAVGDFNGDGKLDLAVANSGSNNVSILLGNGDGTFQNALNFNVGSSPSSVAVGDFNGDDKLDLAVANNVSGNVSMLLGNGDGTFQPAADFDAGSDPSSVAVGDFNGDGRLDLAVANNGSSNVSILLGNGDGTFQSAVDFGSGTGSNPEAVALGDFNGDEKLDLAVANFASGNVSILLGNGDGTFQPATDYTAGIGVSPGALVVGDFNGDGRVDLAVAAGPPSSALAVLLQPEAVSGPNATLSTAQLRFICFSLPFIGCHCDNRENATLSNFGSQPLTNIAVTITGPFTQTNDCGTSLVPGQSCTINVLWEMSEGSSGGLISISDNAPGSPQMLGLDIRKNCTPADANDAGLAASPAGCVGN